MEPDEILATLAGGYQTLQDKQSCFEEMLNGSIIIPAVKVDRILLTFVICFFIFCFMFAFIFTVGY